MAIPAVNQETLWSPSGGIENKKKQKVIDPKNNPISEIEFLLSKINPDLL